MFAAAARLMANVAGTAGTLLVLDDLQWAGADAFDLLDALVRSAGEAPIRVLGAYRDSEMQPREPLGVLLADLAHAGLATQRTLAPLNTSEVEELLAGLLEESAEAALRERVVQRAGGVPFFVVSCAQALRDDAEERGTDADVVPWDVAQSVRQRVAALTEPARDVLNVAAVIGRVVQPALLMDVSEQPEREVHAALDTACRARLLVEDEQAYQFAHDVIREVVEADVGTARRLALHRRIAEALEQTPGEPPVEALAYHYSQSDAHDRAALYLERAGDQAVTQRANAAAEQYYREEIARLDRLGRPAAVAAAREKLGKLLHTVAQYDAALAELERAAETYRAAGDLQGLGRAVAEIGYVYMKNGTLPLGITRLRALLEILEPTGATPALAALYLSLTYLYFAAERFPECVVAADKAASTARAGGDKRILLAAQAPRAASLLRLGQSHWEDALRSLDEAGRLAEAMGNLVEVCAAFTLLGWAYCRQGEFQASSLCAARAIAAAEQIGDPALIGNVVHTDGVRAFVQGEWAESRVLFERSMALLRPIGGSLWDAFPLLGLGELSMAEGSWDEASQYLEQGLAAAERGSNPDSGRLAQRLLAERDLLQGDAAAALARLGPVLDQLDIAEADVVEVLPIQARAHLELGAAEHCSAILRQAIARARAMSRRVALVDALWVQAI